MSPARMATRRRQAGTVPRLNVLADAGGFSGRMRVLFAAALQGVCAACTSSRDVTVLSGGDAHGSVDGGRSAGAGQERSDAATLDARDGGQAAERAFHFERFAAADLSAEVPGCHLASPIAGGPGILAAAGDRVRGFSDSGELRWSTQLSAPPGEQALVVATPYLAQERLFVGYQTTPVGARFEVNERRSSQRVAALDAATGALLPEYPPIVLAGTFTGVDGVPVSFRADHALGRSALVGSGGKLLVTFGNARDLQPWHGFAFELDFEAWRRGGASAALTGSLVVTPEADCGPLDRSGSRQRLCGGGLWSPAGPLVEAREDGFVAVLAPGNGRLDLPRRAYANTLMRVHPGLDFDPQCGPACESFDPDQPSAACTESCRDLFVPRDTTGDAFPQPESGACAGLTLFQCWERLDYVGGSTPVRVRLDDRELLAYPSKDGAVYLIDWQHFGTLYDRKQLVAVCGTRSDPCSQDWAGMIVTEPLVVGAREPMLVVPTFMPDRTHEAGLFGLRLARAQTGPVLERAWQYPPAGSAEARTAFREHPSRAAIFVGDGRTIALLVEVRRSGARGRLLAIDTRDGSKLAEALLDGPGYRFTKPLVIGDRVLVPSCNSDAGPSHLQMFRLAH
jgi:hypothetical protein